MPSDDTPSLDQMRLALLNQIPGQTIRTAPSEWDTAEPGSVAGMNQPVTQQRPLDAVKATFQDLANPFRIVQSMKDAATTLAVKPFVPPAAIISSAVQGLSAAPGIAYRQYLGDPQSMQEAAAIQGSLPTADQLNRQYSQALMPKTAAGQTFEEELGKGFDTAKVPHMWPMSPRGGMVGNITGLEERRPMLSPNDVRVMGAETARVGRQVRDIPTDFVNAQSGLQKLDAITGQPTYGARLQGAAESVGDIVAQREMQGLPAVPGMPAAMQPMNPNMYVIRPFGSTVSQPNVPPSARKGTEYLKFKGNEIDRVITNNLPEKGAPLTPHVALGQYDFAINSNESPDLHTAYNKYINDALKDMYPSLNQGDRFEALRVLYPDQEDRAQVMLGMINGFLETPQAKELALRELGHEVPASDALQQRHDAAVNWLTTRLNDYVSKYIGTSQDPGLSLAAKGMTVLTPDELREYAGDSAYGAQGRRTAAGYPAEGAFAKPLEDKNTEINKQIAIVNDLNSRRAQEERNARDLGILREQHPPWVAVANQAAKGQNQLNTLKTQRGLLEQATNYESLADMAIRGGGVGTAVPPAQRQFWPGSQPAREYIASAEQLSNLGIPEIARKFYDDVMTGKLPVDSIQGLTAPKYIEKLGKAQLATTTNKARLAEEYRRDVTREALATIPPNAPVFGNTKVVELTSATPKAGALREASLATAVLDVCIGEGGRASGKKKHFLTGRDQTWESVLLPNGQPNPKASNKESSYINNVYDNGHTHSVFRDAETGFPVAVFQFQPTNTTGTMYNIGFASGWHNRNIDPKYVDDVRDYLNSRADNIKSISDNTEQNAGITDLNDRRSKQNLSNALGNDSRYLDKYDLSGLPRFVLPKDVRTYIEQVNAANPAVSQAVALTDQRPSDSLPAYVTSSMAAVFADVNESQRLTHDNEGESNRIGVSESYFTNMRDSFDELLRAHTPADALTIFINNLDIEENRLANSNRASNNIIADGIVDLRHSANSLLQIGMPRYMAARNAPAAVAAMQPAVAEQLDPATDGEIAATRDAIGGTFVFPEASPAVQAALRRIGDTIADMAIPGSETVAQYLDNIDGRIMSQIMHIDEIVDNGDFIPTLIGFTSQADVAMYQQGLAVAHMKVRRLQDQLEEGDWVPEPGLLPQLAEPMPEPRAVEPAAARQLPALSYEDESVANGILDILEDPDHGFLTDNASATDYTLLANSFENDPADILGMAWTPYEEALENAAVVRYIAQFLRQRARDTGQPRAVEPAAARQLPALSYEDEDVAMSILDILEDVDNGGLSDNASATEYLELADSFENDPENLLGIGPEGLASIAQNYEDAQDRVGVVRYVAEFLRQRARDTGQPRAGDYAIEPAVALSNEDEGVAMSILDAFHQVELGLLSDNPTSTEFRSLAARFAQNPEDVLGIHAIELEDAQDRAGVVRYVADFFRQRARDTRGRARRGYQKGGAVKKSEDTAAFGIYPNSGIGRQKSDIGDKLNASLVPQDALDLALTVMPFGKVGKTLATAIMAGAPAEAQAGNMSSLLKLVAREAPEQFHSIREALLRTFNTGLEQSVVGSTRMGGPSQVVGGTVDSVIPSKLDIANARQNIAQSPLIDFHTHPNTQVGSSDFKITPSDADLQYWMSTHGRKTAVPNEIKTMIGSPANRQEGATSSYNFFATDKPGQALNRYTYDAARYELQRSKDLQSLKDNPIVGQYLDAGGTLGDLLQSASPMLLQKLYAQQGLGRHEMRLSNAPTAAPAVTESNLFNEIANPAMEVLRSKFANGGIVQQDPTTDQMRYELMMRRH